MLTPNTTYKMNGVTINEKIIPDGTRWKSDAKAKAAGFGGAGSLYKKNQKIAGGPKSVTIHNTSDLANVYDDGEQYTRATLPNENMNSVRVHFYVDDTGAWQNLKAGTGLCTNDPEGSAEVSWHAGDGSTADGGNMTSLSMEIIMGEGAEHDAIAKDNGARIAAWLLFKHKLPIDALVTHTYWVNKSVGKKFSDVDEQCTNLVSGKKWCPSYIFGSTNHSVALANWKAFKSIVKKYLDALNGSPATPEKPVETKTLYRVQTGAFKQKTNADALAAKLKAAGFDTYIVIVDGLYKVQVGAYSVKANADTMSAKLKAAGYDNFITTKTGSAAQATQTAPDTFTDKDVGVKVKIKSGVTKFSNGATMRPFVLTATLYVRKVEQNGKILLVSIYETKKEYTGRVNASDVERI